MICALELQCKLPDAIIRMVNFYSKALIDASQLCYVDVDTFRISEEKWL